MRTTSFTAFSFALLMLLGIASSDAVAGHDRRFTDQRVEILAHRLEESTRSLYASLSRSRHRLSHRERIALDEAHDLVREAKHFHRQVERRRENRRHSARDFIDVARAFESTRHSIARSHPRRRVRQDVRRTAWLIDELSRYFPTRFVRKNAYDRHRYRHYRRTLRADVRGRGYDAFIDYRY